VTYYLDNGVVVHQVLKAACGARGTINTRDMTALLGHAFGMKVEADESVSVNRTITWNDRGDGAASERGVQLSTTWYFAEGATYETFQTFLLLTNPGEADATVEVTYEGVGVTKTYVVPAHSRVTVWINAEGPAFVNTTFGMTPSARIPSSPNGRPTSPRAIRSRRAKRRWARRPRRPTGISPRASRGLSSTPSCCCRIRRAPTHR
jgi:hypothetical protein